MLLTSSLRVVLLEDWQHGGFGLYVHWPFCESKCPYCDFNSHVSANVDQTRWAAAFVSELNRVAKETSGRVLQSIYFGGGTPSLMKPETVEAVIKTAQDHWRFSNNIEITLEANPSSVEVAKFEGFRSAGVNRTSLGVQALNDDDLRKLGRLHTAEEALGAIDVAQSVFDRVSFDLIYARQDQSLLEWEEELQRAVGLGTGHLSLYQLTIEQGTAFGDRFNKGSLHGLPSEDLAADLYFATQSICNAAALPSYETSNHAKIGEESVHNQIYWHSGDYIGVGPGAHGRVTLGGVRFATETYLTPGKWLSSVESIANGENCREAVSKDEQFTEFLLMGLRTRTGVDLTRCEGKSFNYKDLIEDGYLELNGDRLSVSEKGRPLLNTILGKLLNN